MLRSQESALIDWTANATSTTTKRRRLTREELHAKISYPAYKRRQEKLEPLRTDIGRRALEIFHSQKRSFGITNSRLRAGSSVAAAGATNGSSQRDSSPHFSGAPGVVGKSARHGSVLTAAAASRGSPSTNPAAAATPSPAGGMTALPPPFTPLEELPNLAPNKLDEELTRCLEAIATNGASEGYTAAADANASTNNITGGGLASKGQQQHSKRKYSEAETYLRAAAILELKGRYADALEYFSKCVTVDPLLTECYLHRAQCFAKLDDPAAAVDEYKKYLQMEPATKPLLADCGKCALDAGRIDEAEQLFHACLSIGSLSADELAVNDFTIGDGTIVAAGSASVAALLLRNRQRQLIMQGGGHRVVNNSQHEGYGQENNGTLPDDDRDLNEWNISDGMPMANEDEIHDNYCFYNLGEVEERRGNVARANTYYKKVHPSFAAPYFEQGKAEFAEENYPAALRLFEAVAKVLPNEVSVHLWLADTYTALGIDEFSLCVLSCLTNAIALPEKFSTVTDTVTAQQLLVEDPDCKHLEATLLRRGMLYLNILNDLDNALRDFSLCLTHNAQNADALLSRARTLLLRNKPGDEELAVEDYKLVVTFPFVPQTEKAHPYEILGLFYEKKKRFVEAGRFLALAICCGAQVPSRSFYRCATHHVASTSPTVVNGGEELPHRYYDPRGWVPKGSSPSSGDRAFGGADSGGAETKGGGGGGAARTKSTNMAASMVLPMGIGGAVAQLPLISTAVAAAAFADGSGGAPRSAAVMPMSYSFIDSYYDSLRSREPTVHRADECSVVERWSPIRTALDRRKIEAEAAKTTKKKKR